jgi:hypothetical protein
MNSQGFTILFEFTDTTNEFSFVDGHGRFQAYVEKKDQDAPVYIVSRLCRYDVYEITSLIASYHLVRLEDGAPGTENNWKEIRTNTSNAFINALGQAISEQENRVVKARVY